MEKLIAHEITYKNPKVVIDGRIYVKLDEIQIDNNDVVRLIFESENSPHRQAIVVKSDKWILNEKGEKARVWGFWWDGPDKYTDISCRTKNGVLTVYNGWMEGDMDVVQQGGSAMWFEDLPDGSRRYHCNDGDLDNDFDDLVFRIQIIKPPKKIISKF